MGFGHQQGGPDEQESHANYEHLPLGTMLRLPAPGATRIRVLSRLSGKSKDSRPTSRSMATATATDLNRVLVVDDEPNIVDVLSMALRFQGFTVESAGTGRDALAAVTSFRPHLMLLDVMLPDMEGFDVARRLGAQRADVPIIFLTARDATEDKVRGLTMGGDDYVTKPFSLEELVARVRTILRRTGANGPDSGQLVFEDLELDEDAHEVSRGGTPIELTATEFRLLRYLMLNPRRVLTRAQLLDHVWNYDFAGDARVLETYVSYLRKKLDAHGPPLIQTVRGVGLRASPAPRLMASLRTRLIAGLLVVSAAGLVLLGAITYAEQRSFLVDRVDQQARSASPSVSHALDDQGVANPGSRERRRDGDDRPPPRGGEEAEATEAVRPPTCRPAPTASAGTLPGRSSATSSSPTARRPRPRPTCRPVCRWTR